VARALRTSAGHSALGTSGGTAVASRKGLGSIPHDFIADGYRHRIGAAWVGAIVKGGVHVFPLYLKDGEGMSDTNAAILTQLAGAIAAVRGPWIVAGDWSMHSHGFQLAQHRQRYGKHIQMNGNQ